MIKLIQAKTIETDLEQMLPMGRFFFAPTHGISSASAQSFGRRCLAALKKTEEKGDLMNVSEIHFMREKLVQDHRGRLIPTMEVSYSNVSAFHPIYQEAAFYEHAEVSKLYHELGGGRNEGARMGSTVILPHRSVWASLWRISPAEVQIISGSDAAELSAEAKISRHDRARARDRLMRD